MLELLVAPECRPSRGRSKLYCQQHYFSASHIFTHGFWPLYRSVMHFSPCAADDNNAGQYNAACSSPSTRHAWPVRSRAAAFHYIFITFTSPHFTFIGTLAHLITPSEQHATPIAAGVIDIEPPRRRELPRHDFQEPTKRTHDE